MQQSYKSRQQDTRLRVLSVVHFNGIYGGPQNQNARLDPVLKKRGIDLIVLLPDEPGSAANKLRQLGLDVVQQPLHRPRITLNPLPNILLFAGFLPEVFRIYKLIKKRRVDIVLINGSIFPHGAFAARLAGVPVVWQILETRPPMWLRRVAMFFVRSLADVVMSTGMEVASQFPGARNFGDRLISFFPPVDTDEFRPDQERRKRARHELGVPEAGVLVGLIGNLTPHKGHRHFLAVAERLIAADSSVYSRCIGQRVATHAVYGERLKEKAEQIGLMDGGRFGFYDIGTRVAEFLPALDIFMLTSPLLSEGIPTSVLEAMSCGVPVVATDVGSIREAIQDGKDGFIVPAVDEDALTWAASRLVRDSELRKVIGRASRDKAKAQFDVQHTADAYEKAFAMAMSQSVHELGK